MCDDRLVNVRPTLKQRVFTYIVENCVSHAIRKSAYKNKTVDNLLSSKINPHHSSRRTMGMVRRDKTTTFFSPRPDTVTTPSWVVETCTASELTKNVERSILFPWAGVTALSSSPNLIIDFTSAAGTFRKILYYNLGRCGKFKHLCRCRKLLKRLCCCGRELLSLKFF